MRIGATVLLAVIVAAMTAAPALAHVTVDPSTADKGATVKLVFTVPNEKSNASTVKVAVQFPVDHPIALLSVKPKAGWTVDVTTTPLKSSLQTEHGPVDAVVSEVVWQGGSIGPGQFDDFEVDANPLPSEAQVLVFPTTQTYSDGSTDEWSQQTFKDQATPEKPAPQLVISADKTKKAASTSNTQLLAGAALIVGIAALVIGGLAYVNVRRWR
jgi:uncharacterized protein YcnI